ncbi:putative membrane protein [Rhodopirellula sallentina SM41]|uniref:Putative membrane protein n=2 Tax=Rhodopirellula TaxID=265488 RepID=M5U5I8_9BACT|nr:putative membrane protein [Rhodopirellula sallentina SM41]
MTRNQDLALVDLLDRLTDPVSGGRKTRLLLGVFVPLGIMCLVGFLFINLPAVITFPVGRRYGISPQYITVQSEHARYAICLVTSMIATYFHFRWYWGLDRRLSDYSELLTTVSLIGFGAAMLYFVATVLLCS